MEYKCQFSNIFWSKTKEKYFQAYISDIYLGNIINIYYFNMYFEQKLSEKYYLAFIYTNLYKIKF